MSLSAKIREQLINSFRAELAEHVQTINDGLLAMEQARVPDEQRQSVLEDIFRAAHSLKGAARAVGVTAIEQLAHALEDVLGAMPRDAAAPTPGFFNACYRALDAIQMVQAVYESGGITPPVQVLEALANLDAFRGRSAESLASAPRQPQAGGRESGESDRPAAPDETVRISTSKLDALMAHLSELLVTKIRAEQHLAQVEQAQEFMAAWQKEWLSIRGGYGRLVRRAHDVSAIASVDTEMSPAQRPADLARPEPPVRNLLGDAQLDREFMRLLNYTEASQERLRDMNAVMNALSREYANDMLHMALVIDELEQEIKRVRMLPLSTITGPFGRMVRDMAQAAGKEAVLEIKGAEVELDKRVLEQIKDPLIHLLRNAIDHGIEPPQQRTALGKPCAGTITLSAEQLGQDVVLRVADDGAGLNIDAIRQVAARRGVADAPGLSEAELADLIFSSGFSTSPIITDVSGRGVGLDVVRRNVETLRGRLDVAWQAGAGSTFTLTLPLALTSSRGLVVRTSGELLAIPLHSIERIEHVHPREIIWLGGHAALRYGGRPGHPLMLVRLDEVLGWPRLAGQAGGARIPAVVLMAGGRRVAFVVDELAGEQEIVLKGLGRPLSRVGGIAGASVLGNGQVILVLNAADLIKLAMRGDHPLEAGAPAPAAERRARRRVLIVDDSITTRTLEKNILEAAGYAVQLANDGQEALGVIAAGLPDLVIADIVMPRMDGFALTQRLKTDPHTANLPVILVTSLDSPEDKARGIEVGADAYIVKNSFDQNNLLETIEQLI